MYVIRSKKTNGQTYARQPNAANRVEWGYLEEGELAEFATRTAAADFIQEFGLGLATTEIVEKPQMTPQPVIAPDGSLSLPKPKGRFLIRPGQFVRHPDGRLVGVSHRYVGGGCAVTLYSEEPAEGGVKLVPVTIATQGGNKDWITDTVIITDKQVELGEYTVHEYAVKPSATEPKTPVFFQKEGTCV